jgi:hypothetical protein
MKGRYAGVRSTEEKPSVQVELRFMSGLTAIAQRSGAAVHGCLPG